MCALSGVHQLCTSSGSSVYLSTDAEMQSTPRRSQLTSDGPTLRDFIKQTNASSLVDQVTSAETVPYIDEKDFSGNNRRGRIL